MRNSDLIVKFKSLKLKLNIYKITKSIINGYMVNFLVTILLIPQNTHILHILLSFLLIKRSFINTGNTQIMIKTSIIFIILLSHFFT